MLVCMAWACICLVWCMVRTKTAHEIRVNEIVHTHTTYIYSHKSNLMIIRSHKFRCENLYCPIFTDKQDCKSIECSAVSVRARAHADTRTHTHTRGIGSAKIHIYTKHIVILGCGGPRIDQPGTQTNDRVNGRREKTYTKIDRNQSKAPEFILIESETNCVCVYVYSCVSAKHIVC